MNYTALEILERKQDLPILIVDRTGNIGSVIADELKNESLVVFVSRKSPGQSNNIIHIPYLKKIPAIPDNTYSHIFLIDEDAYLAKDVIDVFAKKAEKDNADLIIIVNHNNFESELLSDINSSFAKTKLVVVGDIFAKDYIYDKKSDINRFIKQIKTSGRIDIPGDGTSETGPVFLEDVTGGILEIVFNNRKERLFYIIPKHKVTLLTLAHIFQKKNPGLKIDFVNEKQIRQENKILPQEGVYLLEDYDNLEERIKEIEFEKIQIKEEEKEEIEEKRQKKRTFSVPAIILAGILFLLLPLIVTALFAFTGLSSLQAVKTDIENNNFSSSKTSATFAYQSFSLADKASQILLYEADIFGQGNGLSSFVKNITVGSDVSNAALSIIDAADKLKAVLGGSSNNPAFDFSASTVEIKNALSIYEKETEIGLIPSGIATKLDDLITLVSSTVDYWQDILGFNGQRKYLVLFQNNMELRPGGGFIGSYAILTVSMGRVRDFRIYDVYDADGQLTQHIEPPYPIRRYLPQVHWYLRDSNFDVDFSKGAIASAVFLNTEMHQQVDGVIGVDLSFVKNLLMVIGPVNVIDYNQTVTSDNFFQIAQAHSQDSFFPGSTQKKDFLMSFFNSLQLKLSQEENVQYLNLLQVLSSSIYEKHVIFAFNNSYEEAAFAINGLSSSLVDERQQGSGTINDFMGINEANLGVDKVNYYITRSLSQNLSIASDGSIQENLTVAFKNTAPANALYGDGYKNYLRIILPFGASLKKISIDGQNQNIVPAITDPTVYEKKGFIPPAGLEVDKQDEGQNTIYGFLVNVGPQQLRTIGIEYNLLQKVDLASPEILYSLKIFKQPGVDYYPYDLTVNFPNSLRIVNPSSDFKINGQSAVFSGQILRDTEESIILGAK